MDAGAFVRPGKDLLFSAGMQTFISLSISFAACVPNPLKLLISVQRIFLACLFFFQSSFLYLFCFLSCSPFPCPFLLSYFPPLFSVQGGAPTRARLNAAPKSSRVKNAAISVAVACRFENSGGKLTADKGGASDDYDGRCVHASQKIEKLHVPSVLVVSSIQKKKIQLPSLVQVASI